MPFENLLDLMNSIFTDYKKFAPELGPVLKEVPLLEWGAELKRRVSDPKFQEQESNSV